MKKARVQEEDIRQAARGEGYLSIEEIRMVILENNGQLSIIPKTDAKADLAQDAKQEP